MLYREMFDEVHAPQGLKEEVMNMTRQETTRVVRKVSAAFVIAAVLAVVLAGTALAAVIGVPETLQEWFGKQWTESGGGEMSEEQSAVIDSLVQPVGVSAKKQGITVTLDSVTPGEGGLWLMLKISGENLTNRARFMSYNLNGGPMEKEEIMTGVATVRSASMQMVGTTEDGTQIYLVLYDAPKGVNFLEGGKMELQLGNLNLWKEPEKESEERPKPETIDEKWVLPFTLAPTKNVEALTMEKATVPVNYYKFGDGTKKESGCYTEIENLRITPTGYSFQSTPGEEGQMARFMVILKLKNGVEVDGRPTPVQPNDKEFKGVWELPVNISDVDSVRFCLDDVWLFFNQEEAE